MAFQIIRQAHAACSPGSGSIDLGDCFSLGVGSTGTVRDTYGTPGTLVTTIVNNLFLVAGVIFMITIIYSGFKFIQSGTKGRDEAKQIMEAALIGLIMMFVAYWIVQVFEIIFGADPNFFGTSG